MKKALLMGFAIVVALLVTNPAYAEEYRAISGRVIAEDTGEGLSGIYVDAVPLDEGNRTTVKTDEKGFYVLEDMIPGKYLLSFYKEGQMYVNYSRRKVIEVPRGKNLVNVNHTMELGGAISVTVFGADGITPMSNIRVSALVQSDMPKLIDSVKVGVTDSDGNFILKGLPESDSCLIEVAVPGHAWLNRTAIIEKGKITASTFTVKWDDITGISGYVKSLIDNKPAKNATIYLRDTDGNDIGHTYADATGKYSIVGVPPGTYVATAFWPTGKGWIDKIDIKVESGKSTEVNFEFDKPVSVSD